MRRQCELLGVNRSSLYYSPVEPDAEELLLMRRMGGLSLLEGTRNLSFTMLDVSAWYFQPIYKDWLKLFVRGGTWSDRNIR